MRKKSFFIPFLIIGSILSSCSVGNDVSFRFEPLKIVNVSFPEQLQVLESYKIKVIYVLPSNCHYFEGFDYKSTGENETTVFLVASVFDNQPCQELNADRETSFDFKPDEEGVHRFRFWQGKDENDDDIYYIVEVTVEQNKIKNKE